MAGDATMITIAHPGRYGDLLWALPAVRALTEQHGAQARILLPTDPANTTPMEAIAPLLREQEYVGAVEVVPEWSITQDAPRRPLVPPALAESHDQTLYALGYRSWPERPLPYAAAHLAGEWVYAQAVERPEVYFRSWIQAKETGLPRRRPNLLVHWTDRWFELKIGILREIDRALPRLHVDWYAEPGSRMHKAGATPATFAELAGAMQHDSSVVLTDCSSAHVLAAAIGVPRVLVVEPEEARHHFVFWPGSTLPMWARRETPLGRRIRPVLGGDGRPTFDSRHTIDAILEALHAVRS